MAQHSDKLNIYAPFDKCLLAITDRALNAFTIIVCEDERALSEHIKSQLASKDLKDHFDSKERHTSPFEVLWTASEGLHLSGSSLYFKIGLEWNCEKTYKLNKHIWLIVLEHSPFFAPCKESEEIR